MVGVFVDFSRIYYRNLRFKKQNPGKESRQAALRKGI
jgi:hypothetical protein